MLSVNDRKVNIDVSTSRSITGVVRPDFGGQGQSDLGKLRRPKTNLEVRTKISETLKGNRDLSMPDRGKEVVETLRRCSSELTAFVK